jgi:hypothetical protein
MRAAHVEADHVEARTQAIKGGHTHAREHEVDARGRGAAIVALNNQVADASYPYLIGTSYAAPYRAA